MSGIDEISISQTFLNFIISIATVAGIVVTFFKWKWNQALKTIDLNNNNSAEMKGVLERLDNLCKKIEEMRKKVDKEIMQAKEEHLMMQAEYKELLKELYKLIGQVSKINGND